MRNKFFLLLVVLSFFSVHVFCQEATDVKKDFTGVKELKEDKGENIQATIRVPDTGATMGRKKTDISDNYRDFLIQKLIKSNKVLYK